MSTLTGRLGSATRGQARRWRVTVYWLATTAVVAELAVGGGWDIARTPYVRSLVTQLGYPLYFLVVLGTWKVLGAVALLVPGRAVLKEWAYAGAFFTYTGAMVSHLVTGYALSEVGLLSVMTALTVLSWALRPASRRLPRPAAAPAARDAGGTGAGGEEAGGKEKRWPAR